MSPTALHQSGASEPFVLTVSTRITFRPGAAGVAYHLAPDMGEGEAIVAPLAGSPDHGEVIYGGTAWALEALEDHTRPVLLRTRSPAVYDALTGGAAPVGGKISIGSLEARAALVKAGSEFSDLRVELVPQNSCKLMDRLTELAGQEAEADLQERLAALAAA